MDRWIALDPLYTLRNKAHACCSHNFKIHHDRDSFDNSVTDWLVRASTGSTGLPVGTISHKLLSESLSCVMHDAWHRSIQRFADVLQAFWSHVCCLETAPTIRFFFSDRGTVSYFQILWCVLFYRAPRLVGVVLTDACSQQDFRCHGASSARDYRVQRDKPSCAERGWYTSPRRSTRLNNLGLCNW